MLSILRQVLLQFVFFLSKLKSLIGTGTVEKKGEFFTIFLLIKGKEKTVKVRTDTKIDLDNISQCLL